MDWEEKILTYLVDTYRKSKKDSGDNKNNRRTQVKPEKLYKKYRANDGDYEMINAINEALSALSSCGYISYDCEKFGTQVQNIYLCDNKINEIESELHKKYGYISKEMKRQEVINIIKEYTGISDICDKVCKVLGAELEENRIPVNFETYTDLLPMIAFLENNKQELYIREASMKVYGSSKYFEDNTLDAVCRLLRSYGDKSCEADEMQDEILQEYHVNKEAQKFSMKGDFILVIGGETLDFSKFSSGVEFETSMLTEIEKIIIKPRRFMTIENRTSYLRYHDVDTVTFYLGGYATRFQREFIKKVYKWNQDKEYLHFGDIDAGGFWIHHNLCEITGVAFQLFCMSKRELSQPQYSHCLQKLTENDINRLQELKTKREYSDTVEYMLKHCVKLEQEIISLLLMRM